MPTAYLVCGRPYAGKTTLARLLATESGISLVAFDDPLIDEDLDPRAMDQADWDRVYELTYSRFAEALAGGSSAILDGANKRSTRDTAREIAAAHGAAVRLLVLDADAATCWERWHRNEQAQERAQLARETMELALTLFEPPEPDEHAEPVPSDAISDWTR